MDRKAGILILAVLVIVAVAALAAYRGVHMPGGDSQGEFSGSQPGQSPAVAGASSVSTTPGEVGPPPGWVSPEEQ